MTAEEANAGAQVVGLVLSGLGMSNANKEAVRARWAAEDRQRAMQARIKQLEPLYAELLAMALAPANDTYDDDYLDDVWQGIREGSMRDADEAVHLVRNDMTTGRGIGADSTPYGVAIATVRDNQRRDLGNQRRELNIAAAKERKASADAAEQMRFTRLMALLPALQNTELNLNAGIGGQAAVTGQNAQNAQMMMGNVVQSLARTNTGDGTVNQGNNRGNTNQPGIDPYKGYTGGANPYLLGTNTNQPLPTLSSMIDDSISAPPLTLNLDTLRRSRRQ